MARGEGERAAVRGGRLVEHALRFQLGAKVDVGVEVAGGEPDGLPVAGDGALHQPLRGERVSQVVLRRRVGGIALERRLDQRRGLRMLSALVGDDPREVQRVDVVGVDGDQRAVDRIRLGQASCPVVLESRLERRHARIAHARRRRAPRACARFP